MSSPILITGATGFIGRQLTRDLLQEGHEVRVLTRQAAKARQLFGEKVDIVAGGIADRAAVSRACRGREVVYNIAGGYRFGLRHKQELWRANVDGAENLFRCAWESGVARVVHLSSGGLLRKKTGLASLDLPLDERDFPDQPPILSPYKASKWESERRALQWVRRGLPVVIASTTCPIGRGDEAPTPTGQMIYDFLQRRFPCYCHTGLNFLGVSDLSRGLQLTAKQGRTGERYLLGNENYFLKEFLDMLAEETGLPAPAVCLPGPVVQLIGWGGDLVDMLNPRSTGARVCVETALLSSHLQFFSNEKAQTELGWKPAQPIRESIREAVDWYRAEQAAELVPTAVAAAR